MIYLNKVWSGGDISQSDTREITWLNIWIMWMMQRGLKWSFEDNQFFKIGMIHLPCMMMMGFCTATASPMEMIGDQLEGQTKTYSVPPIWCNRLYPYSNTITRWRSSHHCTQCFNLDWLPQSWPILCGYPGGYDIYQNKWFLSLLSNQAATVCSNCLLLFGQRLRNGNICLDRQSILSLMLPLVFGIKILAYMCRTCVRRKQNSLKCALCKQVQKKFNIGWSLALPTRAGLIILANVYRVVEHIMNINFVAW
jgi:hypothetical protein